MGTHANDAINMAIDHEAEWDNYFAGNMSDYEAYEAGILDEGGYTDGEQLQRVIARNPIGTPEELDNQLHHATKDLGAPSVNGSSPTSSGLNAEAVKNLQYDRPTCNICRKSMTPRNGQYGKFYFCSCEGQGTVSDKYWQSIRKRK